MKKLLSILLIILTMILASCGSSVSDTADSESGFPVPENELLMETDTGTGMLYKLTLDRYTTAFNTIYYFLGGSLDDYPYKNWKKSRSGTSDGVSYDYYYLENGDITLTAAVEQETLYLANVGVGVTKENFTRSKDSEQNVLTVCGIAACAAGGYSGDDARFFGNLFADTVNADGHCFAYGSNIYIYETEKSADGEKTMLFRSIPAAANIKQDWNITDYKTYHAE